MTKEKERSITVNENDQEEELTVVDQALLERNWKDTDFQWRELVEGRKFILIRLHPTSKTPLEFKWKPLVFQKPYEEVGLKESMNAGVVTGKGSGVIVLDVDNVDEFEELHLEVPETFTVKTGKGFHYYYKFPQKEAISQFRNRRKDSYDIRAEMGYVVAPGSIHPSGKIYTVVDDREIVEAPQWLLDTSKASESEVLNRAERQANRNIHGSGYKDLQEVNLSSLKISSEIQELITLGVPAEQDRSKYDFKVIIELIKVGCSDAQIKWIFTEYAITEKSDEHADKYGYLERTIDNAYEAIEADDEDVTVAVDQDSSLNVNEWRTTRIPERQELDVEYRSLAEYATRDLIENLNNYGNSVTHARQSDLSMLMNTFSAMANSKLNGRIAFPLPTGYGKTTAIVSFLARAVSMGMIGTEKRCDNFTIAITAFKVEELCNIYGDLEEAMGRLGVENPSQYISLCHSYRYEEGKETEVNYASRPATTILENKKEVLDTSRPILLLTHNKAKDQSGGGNFNRLVQGRTMLIWDESMLSTDAGAVKVSCLHNAISQLTYERKRLKSQQQQTDDFGKDLKVHQLEASIAYLDACIEKVWEEIESQQAGGQPKSIISFNEVESEITIGEIIEVITNISKGLTEDNSKVEESLDALRDFTRITQHDASVELSSKQDHDHVIVKFDIVIPDAVENVVILDASTWINTLMGLDETIFLPEGIKASLSYAGTTINRINFNSGRDKIESELKTNEKGLLAVIDEIILKHPDEAILLFTHKLKNDVDCRGLIEDYLRQKGHDLDENYGDKLRWNWMTHGNYTANNSFSHCSVMIFVGMCHLPQYLYRARAIAQTRDLTTMISRVDERILKEASHAVDMHQGMNRGTGRVIKADTATPVNVYYTYLDDNLEGSLKTVMPGVEHRLYQTEVLKPRTQLEGTVRAILGELRAIPEKTLKVSKRKINEAVTKLTGAKGKMLTRASVVVADVLNNHWKSVNRSWVRCE